jgi:membrane protein involved in colicin uptake
MSKDKKKSEVRESKPLAESPKYDADASTLADNLKKIQAESAARRDQAYAERKAKSDKRRESMNSKGRQSGGSLQGLNASFGVKIVN